MNETRIEKMRTRLEIAFSPMSLEIVDDSHLHVGHAGARDGKGHFTVRIASARFAGTTPLQRHRMVYDALGTLMDTDIHALRVKASIPEAND